MNTLLIRKTHCLLSFNFSLFKFLRTWSKLTFSSFSFIALNCELLLFKPPHLVSSKRSFLGLSKLLLFFLGLCAKIFISKISQRLFRSSILMFLNLIYSCIFLLRSMTKESYSFGLGEGVGSKEAILCTSFFCVTFIGIVIESIRPILYYYELQPVFLSLFIVGDSVLLWLVSYFFLFRRKEFFILIVDGLKSEVWWPPIADLSISYNNKTSNHLIKMPANLLKSPLYLFVLPRFRTAVLLLVPLALLLDNHSVQVGFLLIPFLEGRVDIFPHLSDNSGNFDHRQIGIFSFDKIIYIDSVQEKSTCCLLGRIGRQSIVL